MKKNLKLQVLTMLTVFLSINIWGADKKIETVALDIAKISKFSKTTVEQKVTHPDLLTPKSAVTDQDGNIYILDSKQINIMKFSVDGKFLKKAGGQGHGPGENIMPLKLLKSGKKISVIDYMTVYVNTFDLDLNLIEQKKFPRLSHPMTATYIKNNRLLFGSLMMQATHRHTFFIFGNDGDLESMKVKRDSTFKDSVKGTNLKLRLPPLVYYDEKSDTLWSAEAVAYEIKAYDKSFTQIKHLTGNLDFRITNVEDLRRKGKTRQKALDRSTFLTVLDNKIFYGYKFHDNMILDVISNSKIITRYNLGKCIRILSLIGNNKILAGFIEDDEDETASVSIIRLEE